MALCQSFTLNLPIPIHTWVWVSYGQLVGEGVLCLSSHVVGGVPSMEHVIVMTTNCETSEKSFK